MQIIITHKTYSWEIHIHYNIEIITPMYHTCFTLFNRKLFHIQRNSSLFLLRIPSLPRETNANSFFISEIFITPLSLPSPVFFLSPKEGNCSLPRANLFSFFFFFPSLFFSMVQRVNEAESPTLNGWMLARCKTLAFSSPFCSLFSLCLYHSIQPFATLFPSLFDHCTLLMLFQTCLCVSNWPPQTIDGISIFPTFIFSNHESFVAKIALPLDHFFFFYLTLHSLKLILVTNLMWQLLVIGQAMILI